MTLLKIERVCIQYLISFCIVASPNVTYGDALLGVYYGTQGWDMNRVRAMETWQGKHHAIINMYTNWNDSALVMDNLFKQQLPNIWANNNVPMITWMPYTNGKSTPTDIEKRIATGQYDKYIRAWADQLKIFLSGTDGIYNSADDRRAYLRLGHEMNGTWYPWGAAVGRNNPIDFINMWRHVVSIFEVKNLDATHLQWIWCVNNRDVGVYSAEQYFPGDDYVDWVAIDGYNWGGNYDWSHSKQPKEVFGEMISRLRALSVRPIAITEFATTSLGISGFDDKYKSLWIAELFSYVIANDIRLVSLFNQNKEVDWEVFGGINGDNQYRYKNRRYNVYSAYKKSVKNPRLIATNLTNKRLLTDAQFTGQ